MLTIGTIVKYLRHNGTVGSGRITEVFPKHWITGRVAYHVQGGAENLTVCDYQIQD